EGLLAGEDLHPGNAALAFVGLVHGRIEDRLAGAPDVGAGAVALDEGEDGVGGDVEAAVGAGVDAVAGGGGGGGVRGHEASVEQKKAGRCKLARGRTALSADSRGRAIAPPSARRPRSPASA